MSADSTGKGSNERWERLQELFSRAVDLSGSERRVFVENETAGDAELRTELLELLACDNGGARTGPLTLALGAALDTTTRDRRKALVGRTLGNYKLVSVLGHGGTGTVYLGERADRQYSAQVAVKIVDNGTMQGELGLRFRAERQILASLNHANIARLIDAGETEEGNPYLVMEYVHGEPLDRYCDREQLGVRERIQLFLDICGAVQYAHQNLVVHRDLKPANILVTAEGAPKLLDFGIAKLLDAGEAAAAMALTRMNDRLLTPEYASPEQILGRPVTTASDVYALGVVLYELLTGLRPYVVPASASQLELERSICITDPLRPSAAVKRARESGPLEGQSEILAVATARRLAPEKLQKRLIGDIDAIVMRALRKEPQHRYNSIEQLASDIRRYLTREPVHARQGNWLYYSQRFVRRHAFGVTAGAAFVVFLAAFAAVSTFQAQRIAAERDRAKQQTSRAEKVSQIMLDTFANADPLEYASKGAPESAEQLLERAGQRVREDLSVHPEVRAELLEHIGRAYRRRLEYKTAISYLRDAAHLRKKLSVGGVGDSATAAVMVDLAISMRDDRDVLGSDQVLAEAGNILRRLHQEHSLTFANVLANRGRVQMKLGKPDEAQVYFDESLALMQDLLGPRATEVANLLVDKSSAFMWKDELLAAEKTAREAVDIYSTTLPKLHPDRTYAQVQWGEVLRYQGRLDEASVVMKEALISTRTIYGQDNRRVADVLDSLAKIGLAQHNLAEGERYAQEAVDIQARQEGADHWRTGYYRTSLASIQIERHKYPEAEQHLRAAIVSFKALSADHPYIAAAEHYLGEVLLRTNRLTDAEAVFMAAMNRSKRANEPAWRAARSASGLGEAMYREGRTRDAEPYLVNSFRTLMADEHADASAQATARERVVRFYTDTGQSDKLRALVEEPRSDTSSTANRSN